MNNKMQLLIVFHRGGEGSPRKAQWDFSPIRGVYPIRIIAEHLSVRHLILLYSDYICMYVCMYVCMSVTDVGAVSISDCTCSLHAEVPILVVYAKRVAPPTKSMSARAIQKARMRAAVKVSM